MFNTKHRLSVEASEMGRRKIVTSNLNFGGGRGGSSTSISHANLAGISGTLLEGFITPGFKEYVAFMDIYEHDPIAGAAVDLMANLPFGDFTLVGAEKEKLDTYNSNIQRLGIKRILPELGVDYLVLGTFVSSLVYQKSDNILSDLIPQNIADCEIIPTPLYGSDPLIKMRINDDVRQFINSKEEYILRIKERLSAHMLDSMKNPVVNLDPLTTIYMPRRAYTFRNTGISLYKRILPLYLLEKTLYKGTILESNKRQRSTLHLTLGDDVWEPTDDEISQIVGLFQQADSDPTNAIIGTRNGIQTNEISSGGDFWKYTDIIDTTNTLKMRALGISDSFLSGDATYSQIEMAMSVFMENLKVFRDYITFQLFYNKLFPLISIMNGYTSDTPKQVLGGGIKTLTPNLLDYKMKDNTKLLIPEVHWSKPLKPEANQDYLGVLATLKDAGLPIPLRLWAVAGGLKIESLIAELDEDKAFKDKIKEAGGGDDDDFGAFASFRDMARLPRKVNLLNRDYGDSSELVDRTKTGKKKYVPNQNIRNKKVESNIALAMDNLQDEGYRKEQTKKHVNYANSQLEKERTAYENQTKYLQDLVKRKVPSTPMSFYGY